jgi:hypothetical protein
MEAVLEHIRGNVPVATVIREPIVELFVHGEAEMEERPKAIPLCYPSERCRFDTTSSLTS